MAIHNPSGTAGVYFRMYPVQQPLHQPFLMSMGGNVDPLLSPKPSATFAYYGGTRFLILDNWLDEWIGVWSSTNGQVWTEAHRAGHCDYSGSGLGDHYAGLDVTGTIFYVAYAYSATEIRIKPFTLTTGQWGTEITGGPAAALAQLTKVGGSWRDYFPVFRADSSLVLIWREYNGSSKMRIRMSIWTVGGGWAAATSIDPHAEGATQDSSVAAVWKAADERIHVLIGDSWFNCWHVSISGVDDSVSEVEAAAWMPANGSDLIASAAAGGSADELAVGLSAYSRKLTGDDEAVPALMRGLPIESPLLELKTLSWTRLLSTYVDSGSVPIPVEKPKGGWWVLVPDTADQAEAGLTNHYLVPVSQWGVGTPQLAFQGYGRTAQGVGMIFREEEVWKIAFVIANDDIQGSIFYWETTLGTFVDDAPRGPRYYAY